VMYWTFAVCAVATAILSIPSIEIITPIVFIGVAFVLGFFMSLGKAAVYKHIPVYYPQNVGAVGGLVGMIGGLGGFVLPLAFGWLKDATGMWSSCFMALFVIVVVSLVWMHLSVRRMAAQSSLQTA
ncbi:MAG: MFS transporter, partial [Aestuariivirga sp.]